MQRRVCLAVCALFLTLWGCAAMPWQRPPVSTAAPSATAADGRTRALDAFREIAFTSEYGDTSSQIRKWETPVRLIVRGTPTAEDLATLNRAVAGLNAVEGFPGMEIVDADDANMVISFVPLPEMQDAVPDYVSGNWGYFTDTFVGGSIDSATVAIATDVTTQRDRNHLIYEEVLQSTGLMQDTARDADSIYYGPWTTTQQPTALDWELLRMLYLPGIRPGMTAGQAMAWLQGHYVSAID